MKIAKPDEEFAESTAGGHNFDPLACRYLYHFCGPLEGGRRVEEHAHSHWQLEIIKSGRVKITFPRTKSASASEWVATAHELVLIPAHCSHSLKYETATSFLSVKFAVKGFKVEQANRLAETPTLAALSTALDLALGRPSFFVDHLLASFMRAAFEEPNVTDLSGEDPIVSKVRALVESSDQVPSSAHEVAAAVGLSLGRASTRFRDATGMSLKQWLDRERFSMVSRLLARPDLSISEVATMCGFEGANTFSRFVSKMSGESPRKFRRIAMSSGARQRKEG